MSSSTKAEAQFLERQMQGRRLRGKEEPVRQTARRLMALALYRRALNAQMGRAVAAAIPTRSHAPVLPPRPLAGALQRIAHDIPNALYRGEMANPGTRAHRNAMLSYLHAHGRLPPGFAPFLMRSIGKNAWEKAKSWMPRARK